MWWFLDTRAPFTPKFTSDSSRENVRDCVEKYMLVRHFSYYYSWRCQRMVLELVSVIGSSWPLRTRAEGRDHVIVRALESHQKVSSIFSITSYVVICVKPTSGR